MKRWLTKLITLILLLHASFCHAGALKKGMILRDAELEHILVSYIEPIFKVAGLDHKQLHFLLIYDPELNAFATTRYTLAVFTGLIQKARTVDELIGVLAHETGHIAGGHMARTEAVMRKASLIGMTAAALGVLAGVASGRGDVASAMIMGGMDTAYKNFFHYSRGQEAAADQAAVRFLNKLHWSGQGLLTFMEVMNHQDLLSSQHQDPYFRTHPMSSDRVQFLQNSLKNDASVQPFPGSFKNSFTLLQAKLDGYLNPPGQTFLKYPEKDMSFTARYARAIAYYRNNQTDKALNLLTTLIKETPYNPYVYEIKGQILYENGRINDAIKALQQALENSNDEPLIKILLAQCLLESQKAEQLPVIIKLLESALQKEFENPQPWRLLAMAYGKHNNIGLAALCLAEEALCISKFKLAKEQAKRALMHVKTQQARLRANDIIALAEEEIKDNNDVE